MPDEGPAEATRPQHQTLRVRPGTGILATEGRVVVRSGANALTFEGGDVAGVLPALMERLDGASTVTAVTTAMGTHGPLCGALIDTLDDAGFLERHDPVTAPVELLSLAAVLSRDADNPVTTSDIAHRLNRTRLCLIGNGREAETLHNLVLSSGLPDPEHRAWPGPGTDALPPSPIVLAAPGGDERGSLRHFNAWALRHRQPWLPIAPFDGMAVTGGPLVIPAETACYECLLVRQRAVLGDPPGFDAAMAAGGSLFTPALAWPALGAALFDALRWLVHADPRIPGLVRRYAPGGVVAEASRCLRVPRCPACSPVASTFAWDPSAL